MPTEFELYLQQMSPEQNSSKEEDDFLYTPESMSYGKIEGYDEIIVDPLEQEEDYELPSLTTSKKRSLQDLRNDPEFDNRASRFLQGIEANEDIFEYLRDSDYSLSSAMVRSAQTGNWTEEQKKDYVYLREQFDNAEINSFKERFQAITNITGDIILDPLNIVTALFAIPSGGTTLGVRGSLGVAAQQGVKRKLASEVGEKAAKETAKQLTRGQATRNVALFTGAEGMAWGGLHNYFLQDIDIDLGLAEDFDLGSVGASALLGGVAGGVIGGGMKYATYKGPKKSSAPSGNKDVDDVSVTEMPETHKEMEFKFSNEDDIIKTSKFQDLRNKVFENYNLDRFINSTKKAKDKAIANTVGKPTTRFLQYVDSSPKLKELLAKVRYDFDTTLTSKGEFLVKAKSYGLALGERTGLYNFGLAKSLGVLNKTGKDALLSNKDNVSLITLLRDKDVVAIPSSDPNKKFIGDLVGLKHNGVEVTDELALSYGGTLKKGEIIYDGTGGVRNLLDDTFNDLNEAKLFKIGTQNLGGYMPRLFNYSKLKENRKAFEEKIIAAKHADPMNNVDEITIRTEDGDLIKGKKQDALGIDMNVFGRDFLEEQGVKARADGTRWLEDATPEQALAAQQAKAEKIVDDMLEERWTPFDIKMMKKDKFTGASNGQLQARRFTNLKDNEIDFVLENNLQTILEGYFSNSARSIERAKFFGRNETEFYDEYLKPIREELKANGIDENEAQLVQEKLRTMYQRITGIETFREDPLKKTAFARTTSDILKISQQLAHLPLATVSSVTEPMLLLARARKGDTLNVAYDIGNSIRKETNDIMFRVIKGIRRNRGKEVSDISDEKFLGMTFKSSLKDDEWSELYQTGLALEQAVQERLEGLAGEGLHSALAKKIQNGFFKVNLLTQWTKAVQLASFTSGKRLIRQNAETLSNGGLSKGKQKYLTEQLGDLGINADEAVSWYRNSLKDGVFDDKLARDLPFYNESYTSGANRFVKEIILNPSSAEANRPLWMSTPTAQLLVQFAGYPTVFTNTVLKRFSNEVATDFKQFGKTGKLSSFQATPKALATGVLMTTVAHHMNVLRSGGENLVDRETGKKREWNELGVEAVRRWGGLGPFEYAQKYGGEQRRNAGDITALFKTFAGPVPQDLIDSVLYRKGWWELVATNAPGYSAYDLIAGKGTKKALRKKAREMDKDSTDKVEEFKSSYGYARGGIVTNVPNVKDEPDEMINRQTGLPFNASSEAVQDLEDRELKSQMKGLGL